METQFVFILGGLLVATILFFILGVFVEDVDLIVIRKFTDFLEWLSFWN